MIEELFSLKGRVALVTGGNGGIGKGIADGLAAAGASIVVAARNEEKTRAAVADIKSRFKVPAMGVQMDVVDEASVLAAVDSAVSEFGTITVLVNNTLSKSGTRFWMSICAARSYAVGPCTRT